MIGGVMVIPRMYLTILGLGLLSVATDTTWVSVIFLLVTVALVAVERLAPPDRLRRAV